MKLFNRKPKKPENEKFWTSLYFGARGSGKSQHQAKEAKKIFEYLDHLYNSKKGKNLKKAVIYSIQKFSKEIEEKYLGTMLFYWKDAKDLRYCPRTICWKDNNLQHETKHRLHGTYLIFDDVAAMFPADPKYPLPVWLIKTFSQARKFGIRILANCQDPFSVNINFRRYVDVAFRFRKIISTPDPDETRRPLKFVFGIYQRRRIKAEDLWRYGDMSEIDIRIMKAKEAQKAEINKLPNLFKGMWRGSVHYFNKNTVKIYDTMQEIAEYKPKGYEHEELFCIDTRHNHDDPKAPNYCSYKRVTHELV